MCSSLSIHFLSLGLEWKLTFSSPVAPAEFSKFAGILSTALSCTALSFRIWNSSTGIPSPPLALFIVMLSKAHLTSHSRMSGSRWVITTSWLSGLWKSVLYSSSVYSCHLFGFPGGSVIKNPLSNAGEVSLIRGLERSPGEGNGYPLQYSCLGSSMVRGAWQAMRSQELDMT